MLLYKKKKKFFLLDVLKKNYWSIPKKEALTKK